MGKSLTKTEFLEGLRDGSLKVQEGNHKPGRLLGLVKNWNDADNSINFSFCRGGEHWLRIPEDLVGEDPPPRVLGIAPLEHGEVPIVELTLRVPDGNRTAQVIYELLCAVLDEHTIGTSSLMPVGPARDESPRPEAAEPTPRTEAVGPAMASEGRPRPEVPRETQIAAVGPATDSPK